MFASHVVVNLPSENKSEYGYLFIEYQNNHVLQRSHFIMTCTSCL